MSPKHQMSPKYLAGQKVDTARFGFPEVTGGWGSLQCSALDQRVCELTVSSFFILKNGQIPSTASFDWYQYQGFWKGFHSLQRIELYKDDDDGRTEEREKRKRRGWWGPGAPGGGDGNGGVWDLREGQTRKEMRMREVEPHLRRELVENEWPGWEYSGGGWEGTMLAGTCWLMTSSSHLAGWPCLRNAGSWKIRAAHFCLIVPPPALMLWQIMKPRKMRNAHCKKIKNVLAFFYDIWLLNLISVPDNESGSLML